MIYTELFEPQKHYEEISNWWRAQAWQVLPLSHLSKTGIVVLLNDKPAAAAWIYSTDSAFALFEWLVVDPEIRKEPRTQVINELVGAAKDVATRLGFETLFITARSESLISRLQKHGFAVADSGMKNMTLNLKGARDGVGCS